MFPTAEGAILELKTLISILVALVLGFAIGLERRINSKEVGIRTHTIVSVGAALMVVISKYGFTGMDFDASRIAAQIVSGIGFLSVGIIMVRQKEVRGLTTAAGIWATAGVGMAAGAGLYIVAAGATIILVLAQCLFHSRYKIFKMKQMYRLNIAFRQTGDEETIIKEIFHVKHFYSFNVREDGNDSVCEASISTDVMYSSEKLIEIRNENPFIISIERIDAQ